MTRKYIDPQSPAAIGHRLMVLRKALDLTSMEMCKQVGLGSKGTAWINYEQGVRRIALDHALELRTTFKIGLNWVYCGDRSDVQDRKLKAKLEDMFKRLGNPSPVRQQPAPLDVS